MASTTALFTGLSGLNANSRNIDVLGNNIANVNTIGYKSNRMLFSSMFSRTYSMGTPPSDTTGGTSPTQVGLGVQIAGTQRSFANGSFTTTGDPRDMAIEGNGFFVVQRGDSRYYTRNGGFRPNENNDLVTVSGERLMGWGVDANWNVVRGELQPVNIPVGQMTIAQASSSAQFAGNLKANGAPATRGTGITLGGSSTLGLLALATASPAPTAPNVLESTTRLVDIEDPASAGSPYYVAGQSLKITGATKGGKILPDAELEITSSTTVQDMMDFVRDALGIVAGQTNPDGAVTGVALDPLTGNISITGSTGTMSDLVFQPDNFKKMSSSGADLGSAGFTTKTGAADGESVRTTVVVYDSLGTPINMDMTMVLDGPIAGGGTRWRWQAEAGDDSDLSIVLGSGTVDFDANGKYASAGAITVSIDRAANGAQTPLSIDLTFAAPQESVTSLAGQSSQIGGRADGAPIGTLESFGIGTNGQITGGFSNGMTRTLGQVVLAVFASPEGLVDIGGNMYTVGGNSGGAVVTEAQSLSAGKVVGGALELSNVDLGQEFISLIQAQTGYSASTRIISTTNEMFQQLLALGR